MTAHNFSSCIVTRLSLMLAVQEMVNRKLSSLHFTSTSCTWASLARLSLDFHCDSHTEKKNVAVEESAK